MKILVLGGTRFVGLRLVRLLESAGHDITILNRGKTTCEPPPAVKRCYADRRSPEAVKEALKGQEFDVVYDIAGYQVRNVAATVELLFGRIGHYIFQCTGAVYAPSDILPIRENFPYTTPKTAPGGEAIYALEKVKCEQFLMRMYREKNFPVTIFRSPIIYGPENWMDDREGSYFYRVLQGHKILVPGNGSSILHYVHVDDVARAYPAATLKKETFGRIYNIAGDEAVTVNGYIDAVARAVGKPAQKVYLEPAVVHGLKQNPFFFNWERNNFFDINKAKKDFGYQPGFSVEKGMSDTYRWWVEKRGVNSIQFQPGKLGHNVDLAYEEEIIAKFGH